MEDTVWEEFKILRSENKRLHKLMKPFLEVGKLLTDYENSKEDFNSSYFTEIYCTKYNLVLDGPALEDYIKLYKETLN